MSERVTGHPCRCGGVLKDSTAEVELFGLSFGVHPCEVCTRCGAEYLDNETVERVQSMAKKRGFFGLEKNLQVSRTGNSIAIRIPSDVARLLKLRPKSLVRLWPIDRKRIQIEVIE